MTDYRVYCLSRKEKLSFILLWFSGAIIIGNLFYDSVIVGALLIIPAIPGRRIYEKYLGEKQRRELSYQFRDLLYSLSSSIAAGHQMSQALIEAEKGMALIYGEEANIRKELKHMVFRIMESKESDEVLLRDMGQRSGLSDIRDFSEVYSICKRTGAGLEDAINKASEILMDKIDIRREIHTLTAQKMLEVRILILLPLLLIVLLRMFSPGYLDVMYLTIAGRIIMTLALMGMTLAAIISAKMIKVEL